MSRYDLTDFEWRVIEPLLPNKPRGVPRVDDRRVLNGIFWVLRSGAPWRDLPERFGPRATCYNRFARWRKAGVWDRLMDAITAAHEGDFQMIDSTSVRAYRQSATAKKGECRSLSWAIARRAQIQRRPAPSFNFEGDACDNSRAKCAARMLTCVPPSFQYPRDISNQHDRLWDPGSPVPPSPKASARPRVRGRAGASAQAASRARTGEWPADRPLESTGWAAHVRC